MMSSRLLQDEGARRHEHRRVQHVGVALRRSNSSSGLKSVSSELICSLHRHGAVTGLEVHGRSCGEALRVRALVVDRGELGAAEGLVQRELGPRSHPGCGRCGQCGRRKGWYSLVRTVNAGFVFEGENSRDALLGEDRVGDTQRGARAAGADDRPRSTGRPRARSHPPRGRLQRSTARPRGSSLMSWSSSSPRGAIEGTVEVVGRQYGAPFHWLSLTERQHRRPRSPEQRADVDRLTRRDLDAPELDGGTVDVARRCRWARRRRHTPTPRWTTRQRGRTP